jgi:uncharacterized cupredoxin-like copper-binding protein
MMIHRTSSFNVTLFVCVFLFGRASAAATTSVDVLLQDTTTDPAIGSMHIQLDRDTVPAGKVAFRAVNQSKNQVHELIVVRMEYPGQSALPYNEKKATVIEKRIHRLGEISDLKPGASGAITLNLKPGSYLLICNQPGHYKAGMTATLSVTK